MQRLQPDLAKFDNTQPHIRRLKAIVRQGLSKQEAESIHVFGKKALDMNAIAKKASEKAQAAQGIEELQKLKEEISVLRAEMAALNTQGQKLFNGFDGENAWLFQKAKPINLKYNTAEKAERSINKALKSLDSAEYFANEKKWLMERHAK